MKKGCQIIFDTHKMIRIQSLAVELLPQKVLLLPELRTLIIADAHLTKETHFRKHGIAVPPGMIARDLERIDLMLREKNIQEIIFLGDMFHSEQNRSMDEFLRWREKKPVHMQLVIGNHDILDASWYGRAGIQCHSEYLIVQELILSHDRIEVPEGYYNLHGHMHPCIRLVGKARQSLRLPCFWFAPRRGVLPAFGSFTGGHVIQPASGDSVYVVADDQVLEIPGGGEPE